MTTQPKKPGPPKGTRKVPNSGGSRKGKPNKVTKALKEMIQDALTEVGGADYLVEQARENPTAFLTLVGKTLPKDLNLDSKGAVTVIVDTGVPRD